MKRFFVILAATVAALMACAGFVHAAPAGVSPGGSGTSPACPTFSWGLVNGAASYELAVYASPVPGILQIEDVDAVTGGPVLSHRVPAPALSWTPSSGQCLGEGDYVWYVRGVDTEGNGGWSAGTAFSVGAVLTDVEFENKVADAVEKYIARQQALAAAAASGTATYEIIDMTRAADRPIAENTVKAASVIMPNAATPTTGASVYLDGDVALANGGGRVGIGTDNMLAGLHVTSDEGVLFEGGTGGAIPKEGPGARMMWYPAKAAFRVGVISRSPQDQWDEAFVGVSSVAMGNSTKATGPSSTAMGSATLADNTYATAMGFNTKATGYSSTAMGYVTTASGRASTAMGFWTKAESFGETALGYFNTLATSPTPDSPIATDRLLVIGNGQDQNNPSDAMVVLKNGNVGIGTTAPGALLDVAGSVRLGVGGSVIQAVQSGTDGLGPGGPNKASWLITFPTPFAAAPRVIATVRNSGTFTDVFAFSISEVTTDGFKVTVYRVDNGGGNWGQSPLLDWVAIQ